MDTNKIFGFLAALVSLVFAVFAVILPMIRSGRRNRENSGEEETRREKETDRK
ncbi:MAG: hypothetical protein ACOYI8_03220 [Christensenellales bacterium]